MREVGGYETGFWGFEFRFSVGLSCGRTGVFTVAQMYTSRTMPRSVCKVNKRRMRGFRVYGLRV